jgi:hypothetical protein
LTRRRLALLTLVGVAAGCADFIGPDPAGAGGAGTTTGTTTAATSTSSTGGGGNDGGGGAGGGPSGPVTSLSVGKSHACAVVEGDVWCWGSNLYAAIGVSATGCFPPTKLDVPDETFRSVGVGDTHTCALAKSGTVFCWGTNSAGQVVGDGQKNNAVINAPSAVPLRKQSSQLSVGADHNCVVSIDNDVVCWGGNAVGQSAPNVQADYVTPTQHVSQLAPATALVVSAGIGETCISNGTAEVECFGGNDDIHGRDGASCVVSGQNVFPLPAEVAELSVGAEQACALFGNGAHECWGSVPPTTCVTFGGAWCDGAPSDGCVLTPSLMSAKAVTATEGFWCSAAETVTCSDSQMNGAQEAPEAKSLSQLGMTGVRLLSASGQKVVCASDSYEVACWGPAMSAALCNNPADDVIPMSFQ